MAMAQAFIFHGIRKLQLACVPSQTLIFIKVACILRFIVFPSLISVTLIINSLASFNSDDQVLVQQTLFVRTLTLNRPRQLNALSLEMIARLSELLLAYENNANVKLIIVKGNGRAFFAGGDLATIHGHFLKGNLRFGARVSQTLLTLTFLIATLSKPQACLLFFREF